MTQDTALIRFQKDLSAATTAEQAYGALDVLTQELIGVKLFTLTEIDMEKELARRAYTSDAKAYPVSGTKPIVRNRWFAIVHDQQECFVANKLADVSDLYPDYELIASLGCQSAMNLPLVIGGTLVATVNLLDVEGNYTDERVQIAKEHLLLASVAAYCVAERFS